MKAETQFDIQMIKDQLREIRGGEETAAGPEAACLEGVTAPPDDIRVVKRDLDASLSRILSVEEAIDLLATGMAKMEADGAPLAARLDDVTRAVDGVIVSQEAMAADLIDLLKQTALRQESPGASLSPAGSEANSSFATAVEGEIRTPRGTPRGGGGAERGVRGLLKEVQEQHEMEMAHLKMELGTRLENVIQSAAEARADINADLEEHLESSREERDGLESSILSLRGELEELESAMEQRIDAVERTLAPIEKSFSPPGKSSQDPGMGTRGASTSGSVDPGASPERKPPPSRGEASKKQPRAQGGGKDDDPLGLWPPGCQGLEATVAEEKSLRMSQAAQDKAWRETMEGAVTGLDELLGACELSALPSLALRVSDLERLVVEAPQTMEAALHQITADVAALKGATGGKGEGSGDPAQPAAQAKRDALKAKMKEKADKARAKESLGGGAPTSSISIGPQTPATPAAAKPMSPPPTEDGPKDRESHKSLAGRLAVAEEGLGSALKELKELGGIVTALMEGSAARSKREEEEVREKEIGDAKKANATGGKSSLPSPEDHIGPLQAQVKELNAMMTAMREGAAKKKKEEKQKEQERETEAKQSTSSAKIKSLEASTLALLCPYMGITAL